MDNRFFLLKPDTLLHITYIGRQITPEHWKHFPRTVNEHIMYAVYAGEMYIREEEREYHLREGDIIMLEAGKTHSGYRFSSCSYFYVHFTPISQLKAVSGTDTWQREQIQRILQMNYNTSPLSDDFYSGLQLIFPKYIHMEHMSSFHGILACLQTSLQYHQAKQPYYKTAESCCIMEMLCSISRAWMDSAFSHDQMDLSVLVYSKTDQILNYLHTSYDKKISGSDIEEYFSMNFDYLNRIFKKRTQRTIFAYLNSIRLEQAKQLLLTTHLPLSEIAARTGFSDVYYFSRAFKKALLISPARFRKTRTATPVS